MGKHLSESEKKYIADNSAVKKTGEIAMVLNRPAASIKVYMSKNGLLKSPGPSVTVFTGKKAKYIHHHFKSETIVAIASHLKEDYYRVYAFCVRAGLIKLNTRTYTTPVVHADNKTPILRPPAVYSNTRFV